MKERTTLLRDLPDAIAREVKKEHPEYTDATPIDTADVLDYHLKIIEQQMEKQSSLITKADNKILKSIRDNEFISQAEMIDDEKLTLGQKAADGIAKFGGSWGFIFIFITVLVVWIVLNATAIFFKAFDPYPFILLNLALSCLAAIQAPIIMMSQNRQEDHDRKQSIHDYEVNLKSEIEIRLLHEKMDHLIYEEMKQLQNVQKLQSEFLKEIRDEVREMRKG